MSAPVPATTPLERNDRADVASEAAWATRLRAHWPLGAVLGAFVLSMFIVPTLADVAISDDWVFMWSAERLVETGKLEVHPLVSPHLVFQAAWGALFGLIFGVTPGVLRVSVVVLWLLSGIAFYGIVWELTGKRALSALGASAYLFNPLGYVLAFTFMTDVPWTSSCGPHWDGLGAHGALSARLRHLRPTSQLRRVVAI